MSDDKRWRLSNKAEDADDELPGEARSDPLLTPGPVTPESVKPPLDLDRPVVTSNPKGSFYEDEIRRPVVMSNPKGSIYDTTRVSGVVALGLTVAGIIAGIVAAVVWFLA